MRFVSPDFDAVFTTASDTLAESSVAPGDCEIRLAQWRRDEWHNWFRWRLCRKGFDWSKPIWILSLVAGFAAFIIYGWSTQKYHVTAGGVVAWFTLVNLGYFVYFGLTLPGPPRPVPGPFAPGQRVRAAAGLYPANYERRKLARVWVRVRLADGSGQLLELTFKALPPELASLLTAQSMWRIQRADAPLTEVVLETLPVTRADIDAGELPLKIAAHRWDPAALQPFDRTRSGA